MKASRITAAAALVLAIGGGMVGGALAVSGNGAPATPPIVNVDRVAGEGVVAETPAPEPTTSEAPAPALATQSTTTQEEPAPTSSTPAAPTADTASGDASRARAEADRAKVEADRATDAATRAEAASPAPTPVIPPKPTCEEGETSPEPRVAPTYEKPGHEGRVRTCQNGKMVVTEPGTVIPKLEKSAPAPAQSPAPEGVDGTVSGNETAE